MDSLSNAIQQRDSEPLPLEQVPALEEAEGRVEIVEILRQSAYHIIFVIY